MAAQLLSPGAQPPFDSGQRERKELDRRYLRAIIEKFECGPVGLETLAAMLGEERDTLEDMVEPFLLQLGFLNRTNRGRSVTRLACEHLGLPYRPKDNGDLQGRLL